MTRSLLIYVAILLATAAACHSANAGFEVIQGDFVGLDNGPGSSGGVFHIDVQNRGTTSDFDTFCVELDEHINFDATYYVESVGHWTKQGNRKLGAQAAWLYTQFLDPTSTALTNFQYGLVAGNPSSTQAKRQADALQLGIWRGMVDQFNNPNPYSDSQINTLAGWSQTYINDLTSSFLSGPTGWIQKFNTSGWTGTGNIQIMNLRTFAFVSNTYSGPNVITLPDGRKIKLQNYAQDQLVSIDPVDQQSVVPELPSFYSACSLMSCAIVFALFTYVRRRVVASTT